MNEILVVANWKSNKNSGESVAWLQEFYTLAQKETELGSVKVVICPPFVNLPVLASELKKYAFRFPVALGAQNVSPFGNGSYTGEVSASQLTPFVTYCLVGHSERRTNFAEKNDSVFLKIQNLLQNNIQPILCAQSIEEIPDRIREISSEKLFLMFEPAKAISAEGVYKAESPETVKETIDLWKEKVGSFTYLYGGSVNETNCKQLLTSGVDGFVVGHASLTPSSFLGIIKNV